MAKINLLPWREKLRLKQRKEFLEVAGLVAALGGVIVFAWSVSLGFQIDEQIARNDRLKEEIQKLDGEIEEVKSLEKKRNVLVSRMKIITGLQANRPYIVHLFDELVRTLPEGVYYKNISRTEGSVKLSGEGDSNDSVSALMRKLDASPLFKTPVLTGVTNQKVTSAVDKDGKKEKTQSDVSIFNLTVAEEALPSAADKKGAGK